MEEFQTSKR